MFDRFNTKWHCFVLIFCVPRGCGIPLRATLEGKRRGRCLAADSKLRRHELSPAIHSAHRAWYRFDSAHEGEGIFHLECADQPGGKGWVRAGKGKNVKAPRERSRQWSVFGSGALAGMGADGSVSNVEEHVGRAEDPRRPPPARHRPGTHERPLGYPKGLSKEERNTGKSRTSKPGSDGVQSSPAQAHPGRPSRTKPVRELHSYPVHRCTSRSSVRPSGCRCWWRNSRCRSW